MMNYMTDKIKKNSKIVKILLRIVIVVMAIMLCCYLISYVRSALTGELIVFGNGVFRISFYGNDISPENAANNTFLMVCGVLILALFLAIFIIAESIFRLIQKSESPFIPEVPKRMKLIAVLLLLAQIVPRFLGYFIRFADTGRVSVTIIDEGTFVMIIIAMIIYCFAAVFDYGCVLQRESDETL